MANIIVCEGNLFEASSAGRPVPNVLACDTGWIVKSEPATDFQGLIDLLSFDPEMCALLIGICVLFFIIGHSAGHVARNLGRV
jgi:hypothetical protein